MSILYHIARALVLFAVFVIVAGTLASLATGRAVIVPTGTGAPSGVYEN